MCIVCGHEDDDCKCSDTQVKRLEREVEEAHMNAAKLANSRPLDVTWLCKKHQRKEQ